MGKIRVTSYFPEQLGKARFERSWLFGPRAGDRVFRKVVTTTVKRHIDKQSPLPDRVEVYRGVKSRGFLMLRDALAIESLLQDVARGAGRHVEPGE